MDPSLRVWVPDEKELFLAASVVFDDLKASKVTVKLDKDGSTREIDSKLVAKMNPAQFEQVGDMAELTYLNEPSVVHNLRERWQAGKIYTYSGLFLVAVNPYRSLPIYDSDSVQQYLGKRREDVAPHIYAVAEQSFRSMLSSGRDQSILITGESGAGKTENTKKAIQYLSSITTTGPNKPLSNNCPPISIDERILQTNPILEAFGNAQTIRNANSSRFGKFIKINFERVGHSQSATASIVGASIEWYLLEKSRVVTQHSSERNYHVFYQLLAGAPATLRERLQLPGTADPKSFTYLKSGAATIDGVDDVKLYEKLVEAFEIMGFSSTTVDEIMTVVAAILYLGQVEFRASSADQGSVVNTDDVERVANLLGISHTDFLKAVLQPQVKIGREVSTQSRTASQAQHTVNAIAKALYERLFGHIVEQLNVKLGSTSSGPCIGVLDIAGFEIFEQNSFEQLCINYTNERLQQFFNHHMFVLEQQEYVKEKVDWEYVDYGVDLQPTIDLIEQSTSPMGIFSCLNEESLLPSGTEQSFTEKLVKQWGKSNSKFQPSRLNQGFKITHYAQTVDYDTEGWLEKNKDPLSDSAEAVLSSSSNTLIQSLFPVGGSTAVKSKAKGMLRTVAQRYKEQLTDLMSHLEATHPHFVRCILPNTQRSPSKFENRLVLDQLRYNGVLEGIRIARSGFPNRLEFSDFYSRYRSLAGSTSGRPDSQQTCAMVLNRIGLDTALYKVGQSKVFFRNGVLADLEHRLDQLVESQTVSVQTVARGALTRVTVRNALHRRQAAKVLAAAFRINNKNASDPWWQVTARLKPLLLSKETMDNSKKDMRMQKLETSLHRMKEEQVDLISSKNELRAELITALKDKEHLERRILDLESLHSEKSAAHELAISSAMSRDEASKQALKELSENHGKLFKDHEKTLSDFKELEVVWQNRLEKAVIDKSAEYDSIISAMQSKEEETRQNYDSQLALVKAKAEEQEKLFKSQLADTETKIVESDKLKAQLEKKFESDIVSKEQQIKELQTEVASALADKVSLQESVQRLTSEQNEHLRQADEVTRKLKLSEKSLEELKLQSTKTSSEQSTLQKELQEANSTIEKLRADREQLLSQHSGEFKELKIQLSDSQNELKTLQNDKAKLEKIIKERDESIVAKSAEIENINANDMKMKEWLGKAKNELKAFAASKKKMFELNEEHKATLEELGTLKSGSVELSKFDTVKQEAVNLQKELKTVTENFMRKEKDLNASNILVEALEAEISELKPKYQDLKNKLKQVEDNMKTMQVSLNKTITDGTLRIESLKNELAQSDVKNKNLAGSTSSLEKELRATRQSLEEKTAAMESMEVKLNQLNKALSDSKAKSQELTELISLRSPVTAAASLDSSHTIVSLRKELEDARRALNKSRTQSSSPSVSTNGYAKRFGLGDIEQENADLKHDLAAALAKITSYESDLKIAKENHAQYILLNQKYEKVQRDKAELHRKNSQLLLSQQKNRGQDHELDVAKAQASDVKRMISEIKILKLQLARTDRENRELAVKLEDSIDEKDFLNLKHRLRLAEISKLQLSKTIQQLSNAENMSKRPGTQIRRDPTPDSDEAGEPLDPNDPPLVVDKRGVHQALRNISNDRRVSEQAYVTAEKLKSKNLTEAVEFYKSRVCEFNSKLEKAESTVQAALRAEKSATEQTEALKMRLNRIESDHADEIAKLKDQMLAAENQLIKQQARSNRSSFANVRTTDTTSLKEIAAERDQLAIEKNRLEKRLQDLSNGNSSPTARLSEQVQTLRKSEHQMLLEQKELRWKIDRKERYLDTMRKTLRDTEEKYEKSLNEIDRLQASEASREIVLRRASREVAEAKSRYIAAERELRQYHQARRPLSAQRDDGPVFI